MSSPDLSPAIYAALTGNSGIASALAQYEGAAAIFTRRPVPSDAPFPMIICAGDVVYGDEDFLDAKMPMIVRDIAIYGQQPADYRTVENLGRMVRDLFHRNRSSLSVAGWSVVDIRCTGPIQAPTDDDQTCGRLVSLTIRLS